MGVRPALSGKSLKSINGMSSSDELRLPGEVSELGSLGSDAASSLASTSESEAALRKNSKGGRLWSFVCHDSRRFDPPPVTRSRTSPFMLPTFSPLLWPPPSPRARARVWRRRSFCLRRSNLRNRRNFCFLDCFWFASTFLVAVVRSGRTSLRADWLALTAVMTTGDGRMAGRAWPIAPRSSSSSRSSKISAPGWTSTSLSVALTSEEEAAELVKCSPEYLKGMMLVQPVAARQPDIRTPARSHSRAYAVNT